MSLQELYVVPNLDRVAYCHKAVAIVVIWLTLFQILWICVNLKQNSESVHTLDNNISYTYTIYYSRMGHGSNKYFYVACD